METFCLSTSSALGQVLLCSKSTLRGSSCPSPGKRVPISSRPALLLSPAERRNAEGAETGASETRFARTAGLCGCGGWWWTPLTVGGNRTVPVYAQ